MRRVMICGAGIAGLTLAWWLRQDAWQVQLVERAAGQRDEGYMIDFFGSGYDVAERMGLIPQLREIQTANTDVSYVGPTGRSAGRLEYHQFAEALGGRGMTFMRGGLERVLHEALDGSDKDRDKLEVRYGTTVKTAEERAGGVAVTLEDDSVEQVDLLVGADGIHSRVRGLLFGPEQQFVRPLGYHTASYLVDDDLLRIQAGDRFLVVAAPGRQVGVYPTNDGRVAIWLVHRTHDAMIPADTQAAVKATYTRMGPLAARAVDQCPPGDKLYYDLVAQIEAPAWSRGPVGLIGDAAYAVSLMAGQGASLAMGGAWAFAHELRQDGVTTTEALRRYERRVRPFIATKQKSGRRTAKWLVPRTSTALAIRHMALSMSRWPGATALMRPAIRSMFDSVVTP